MWASAVHTCCGSVALPFKKSLLILSSLSTFFFHIHLNFLLEFLFFFFNTLWCFSLFPHSLRTYQPVCWPNRTDVVWKTARLSILYWEMNFVVLSFFTDFVSILVARFDKLASFGRGLGASAMVKIVGLSSFIQQEMEFLALLILFSPLPLLGRCWPFLKVNKLFSWLIEDCGYRYCFLKKVGVGGV